MYVRFRESGAWVAIGELVEFYALIFADSQRENGGHAQSPCGWPWEGDWNLWVGRGGGREGRGDRENGRKRTAAAEKLSG